MNKITISSILNIAAERVRLYGTDNQLTRNGHYAPSNANLFGCDSIHDAVCVAWDLPVALRTETYADYEDYAHDAFSEVADGVGRDTSNNGAYIGWWPDEDRSTRIRVLQQAALNSVVS